MPGSPLCPPNPLQNWRSKGRSRHRHFLLRYTGPGWQPSPEQLPAENRPNPPNSPSRPCAYASSLALDNFFYLIARRNDLQQSTKYGERLSPNLRRMAARDVSTSDQIGRRTKGLPQL